MTDIYPKGSLKGQTTDGLYMDATLAANLDILAERIVDDMMFVMLGTGHGRVRVGKSVFMMQISKYLTYKVNQLHKFNNDFNLENNVVWKGKDMIEKASKLKPYSVLLLDEGDDLVDNYWADLSKRLRKFFRKCGQLNLFIILILPDFFELPRNYAITRSDFLIDVKFYDDFRRGVFAFYNFERKRKLYVQGKKYGDYECIEPSFEGRFTGAYVLDEQAYRELKRKDLIEDEEKESVAKPTTNFNHKLLKVFDEYCSLTNKNQTEVCKEYNINYSYLQKLKSVLKKEQF